MLISSGIMPVKVTALWVSEAPSIRSTRATLTELCVAPEELLNISRVES